MRIIFTFLCLFTLSANSQEQKDYFINGNGETTAKENAKYHRIAIKNNELWAVKDYYLNGSIYMEANYTNKRFTRMIGTAKYYYLNGNMSSLRYYMHGKKQGEWTLYNLNGSLSQISYYNKSKIPEYIKKFDENGKQLYFIENMDYIIYNNLFHNAKPWGGEYYREEYLSEFEYPTKDFDDEVIGKVYAAIYVNEKGKIEDFDIIMSATPAMDSTVIVLIKKLPTFIPFTENGVTKGIWMVLPISFSKRKKIIVSDKELSKHFFNSGINDFKNEKYEKAKFKFDYAISLDNMNAKFYKNLAFCYSMLGNDNMACEYFNLANILDTSIVENEIKTACKL